MSGNLVVQTHSRAQVKYLFIGHRYERQMQFIARILMTYRSTRELTASELRMNSAYTDLKLGFKRAVVNNDINGITDLDFSKQ
jgi:hypothetical protein